MKAFFSKSLSTFVLGSVCDCGHLESDHGSLVKTVKGFIVKAEHHGGSCCVQECKCSQFTWKRWATEDEFGSSHRFDADQNKRLMAKPCKK